MKTYKKIFLSRIFFFFTLLLLSDKTAALYAQTVDALLEYEVAVLNPETLKKYNRIYSYEPNHAFEAPDLTDAVILDSPLTVFYPVLEGIYPLVIIMAGRFQKNRMQALPVILPLRDMSQRFCRQKRKVIPKSLSLRLSRLIHF